MEPVGLPARRVGILEVLDHGTDEAASSSLGVSGNSGAYPASASDVTTWATPDHAASSTLICTPAVRCRGATAEPGA